MKKGKSKQSIRIDWQRRELIRNLEVIFKEGSRLYPLMNEKEVCDKIMTLPLSKAPKNKAELFMVMAANHAKNEKWAAKENPEAAPHAEGGETLIDATFAVAEPVVPTPRLTFTSLVAPATPASIADGQTSSKPSPTSEPSLSDSVGNLTGNTVVLGSGTPS